MTGVVSESGVTTEMGLRASWPPWERWGIVRGVASWEGEGNEGVDRRYAGGGDGRGGCSAAMEEAMLSPGICCDAANEMRNCELSSEGVELRVGYFPVCDY